MDAKESLQSAIDRFHSIASELGRFMADSEKVFLSTGARLQHVEDEADRVLTESSNATRMGGSGGDPAEALRKGLGQLDQHLEHGKADTEKGLRALSGVLAGIVKLSCLDGDFQTIVATLHALASTTHLENSRRDMGQAGFDTVVSDLRSMAVRIKPKFGEVLSQGRDVRATAESALTQARSFLDRHRRDVEGFRRETRKQLAAMSGACQISYALASRSAESMTDVRSSSGKVLQSLQVQDIARQMLEHVVEDLEEFANSAQAVVNAAESTEVLRSWLAELALLTRVEAAQLANACGRLVNGLSQIDDSLQSIVSTLSATAKESSNFSGKSSGTSVLAQLERGIRTTTETLRAHDAQKEAMMKALGKVCGTASGVERLVDEVAILGEDARFIGLNAMVKAVRVGQAGATLTVLAREIQNVSDQIQAFTSSAASIMQSVGEEARLLVSARSGHQAEAALSGEEVAAELERLVSELGTYQSSLANAAALLLSCSGALRSDVGATSQALHELVERAKQLRRISHELSSLHSVAVVDSRGAQPPAGRAHIENRRHTMEEERQVQRAVLSTAAQSTQQEVERSADTPSQEGSIEFF